MPETRVGCGGPRLALVHDYITQRGGAERVLLAMTRAFPEAPVYTSLHLPEGSYPEFAAIRPRTLPINRLRPLRRRHRLGLPLFAAAFSRLRVAADVVICSSSGWAHGCAVDGRKVVYCHTPARWLYEADRYLGARSAGQLALRPLKSGLVAWDGRAARTADLYLANSSVVRDRIWAAYRIEAEIVPPPHSLGAGPLEPVPGLEEGFFLCVSRLLPYKNVERVMEAFARLPRERLVVVGQGPLYARLRAQAPANVRLLGTVDDARLRWIYGASAGVVAASYEDYGLTPLEAASFGKPSAVLAWGGYLDTVVEGETGVFFLQPEPAPIAAAVTALAGARFSSATLKAHAGRYSEAAFSARLERIVKRLAPRAA